MYLKMYQKILNCCTRQIHTNVSRTLLNQYYNATHKKRLRSSRYYWSGFGVLVLGMTYASVPLYRVFCQAYNYGGTLSVTYDSNKVRSMIPVKEREIKVKFNADTGAMMQWNFKPQQNCIKVLPGETALAFFTAKNPLDKPITGVSTYNVVPYEAAQYFHKIQCFCFEEQQLNPHEEVDLPVFFYIDPAIVDDPKMEDLDEIILSYTFFEAKGGIKIPLPSFLKRE
ncbi:Cytochrome c oxidase assembly protein COX11, mitochondrial [Habropoda laboriosa]|uniref:Cytochrome c oxidase assembly protein COX11, mitochondrial n=1 Tax=Habropoda laboriosa TaxID=597456 RepID=A0A0L7R0H3_9HYME|nr:PREDICTED: cytochrome c oxidase assembly protein COX11, mitochondrial [Habropoda laboriosa]KOC64344.1 Cytochrome c oxidase assembly protein COX11, mitochondrial [Habropoda laboriosa]